MKKSILLLAAIFLLIFSTNSYALTWNWDLNGTNVYADWQTKGKDLKELNNQNTWTLGTPGLGTENEKLSTIKQNFLDNGTLGDGATFSEFGWISEVAINGNNVSFYEDSSDDPVRAFFKFEGLTGYITDYDPGDGPATSSENWQDELADDTFDLVFDPNVGTIEFWLDSSFETLNTTDNSSIELKLADLNLLEGKGAAPEPQIGEAQGDLEFTVGFDDVEENIWSLENGSLFEDWLSQYGANSIFATLTAQPTVEEIAGPTDNNNLDDLIFQVSNEGQFKNLNAVPEPTTLLLFGTGLLGLAAFGRKKFMRR